MSKDKGVNVRYDKALNLKYIMGAHHVLFENGLIVPTKEYETRVATDTSIADLLKSAASKESSRGWDFEAALREGTLVKKGRAEESEGKDEVKVEQKKTPVLTKGRLVAFFSAPHTDIILMMLTVGVLCVWMSIYHTFTYLHGAGKGVVVAAVAAVGMVIYSASAFTASRHVWQDKGISFMGRLVSSSFLLFTGVFVVAFSVFSTTSVSYDQYKAKNEVALEATVQTDERVVSSDVVVSAIDRKIADKEAEIGQYEKDLSLFRGEMEKGLPEIRDPDDKAQVAEYWRVYNARAVAKKSYDSTLASWKKALGEKEALINDSIAASGTRSSVAESVRTEQTGAYGLVASKLGISIDTLQFIIYVIPAAFFDIVAPFAMFIVLMLKDRRNGKVVVKEPVIRNALVSFLKSFAPSKIDKVEEVNAQGIVNAAS